MILAVTIDYHNTLYECDDWFRLEVRELPSRFVSWLSRQPGGFRCDVPSEEITRFYRQLRHQAIESGIEVDSIGCVSRVCEHLGIDVPEHVIATGVDTLMREVIDTARPRRGAVELVRSLRATGIKLGVISNAIHQSFLEWTLERDDLLQDFDLVLSSAKAGYYKSRVELYHLAAQMLDVLPEQIVHVGDSYRFDVLGASNSGMRTVWLKLSSSDDDESQADLIVSSLDGLADRLRESFELGAKRQSGAIRAN